MQGLRHRQEASVGERGSDETLLDSEVLETVEELGVGHLHDATALRVGLLRVKVEAHGLQIQVVYINEK